MVLHSYVQLKPDPVIPINEADGFFYVVLIDMYVSHVQSNGFQGKLYLPCHQIQVIKVRGQTKVRIRTALVCRYDQSVIVNLELYEAETRGLVAFHLRRAQNST